MLRTLVVTLAFVALVFVGVVRRTSPPEPTSRATWPPAAGQISLERAREAQRAIVGAGASRTVGSAANEAARAWLVEELTRHGWRVDVQRGLACGRHGTCGWVANVVGWLDGTVAGSPAILLAAHYDSVGASAGASDDAVGAAAVVEAARVIASGPRGARPFVALFTDGEESGLLGAELFVRSHPYAKRIRGFVNVDSRGSSGPSMMFETTPDNADVVSLYAARATRPLTSSLFYEAYRRMPNDTDFTVLKSFGNGLNFANIARIQHYHTSLDTLDNADIGTLYHHTSNVLAGARALEEAPLDTPTRDSAVWFDILGFGVVRWPAPLSLPLALAALVSVVAGAARRFGRRAIGAGLGLGPLAIVLSLAGSYAIGGALRSLGVLVVPWIAHPASSLVALCAGAVFGALLAAALVFRVANRAAKGDLAASVWTGIWSTVAAIGVALAWQVAGASYLFIVPAGIAGLSMLAGGSRARHVAIAIPVVVMGLLWLALVPMLYEALGFFAPPLVAISFTMTTLALLPLLAMLAGTARVRFAPLLAVAALATAIAGVVVAAQQRPFSVTHPQRANVVLRAGADDADGAHVIVETSWGPRPWGKPPSEMLAALSQLGPVTDDHTAWSPGRHGGAAVKVAPIPLPRPVVTVLSSTPESTPAGSGRRVRLRLASMRDARTLFLSAPRARVREIYVSRDRDGRDGQARERVTQRYDDIALFGVPADGIELSLLVEGDAPLAVRLTDQTGGLPTGSHAVSVAAARPPEAAPSQDGDITTASTDVDL